MSNMFFIAGHLGSDPEVRVTPSNVKVTSFRVAVNSRKGQTEQTIWVRVTIWGTQFEKMIPHFKKGSSIMVWGELRKPEIYTDREGKPQVTLEMWASQISFSPFGRSEKSGESAAHPPAAAPFGQTPDTSKPSGQTFDDEVPF